MNIRRSLLSCAPLVCAIAALPMAVAAASGPGRFGPDDLNRIVGLSSPQLSPDGKRAIVVVSRINVDGDTYERELDSIDVRTHERRSLTYRRKGLSQPAFSPQGDRIAFLADDGTGDDAKAQIFVLRLDGGDARQISTAPEGVAQFAWRPDGAAFAYVAEDAKPKLTAPAKYRDSFVVANNPITAREAPRPLHLWTVSAGGGTAQQLTSDAVRSVTGGEAAGAVTWSPDGKTLAFALAPGAVLNDASQARVALLEVASGAMRYLTGHTGNESDPRFSPDGTRIAYAHSTADNQITLVQTYVTTPAGGEGSPVTVRFDRAIHDYAWAPNGGVYFTCNDGTRVTLGHASLAGATSRIELGDVEPVSPLTGALARDGSLVFVGTTNRSPSELYYRSQRGAAPVALTNYNAGIAALDLARSETVTYESDAGVTADAVLLTPPGFVASRTYPLVLLIHGGPTSATTRSFNRLGQLMAARGWLVLEPNYRGSDNHGFAYQSSVRYDPEDGPGRDIEAAVAAVRARGIVDPNRIAVSGWSYGGIMTAWMVTHYHEWKAAVSGASVNDWSTDYSVADDSDSDAALFHSGPWAGPQARAEYERASAVTYAKDVTSPVLILSDVGDNRDPIATSYEFYHALKDNGKDVTFVAWPVAGHFPADPVRTLDVYQHWIDYIAAHF